MTVIDKICPPKFYIPIPTTFGHFKRWMSRYNRLNVISLSIGKRFYKLIRELYLIVLFMFTVACFVPPLPCHLPYKNWRIMRSSAFRLGQMNISNPGNVITYLFLFPSFFLSSFVFFLPKDNEQIVISFFSLNGCSHLYRVFSLIG